MGLIRSLLLSRLSLGVVRSIDAMSGDGPDFAGVSASSLSSYPSRNSFVICSVSCRRLIPCKFSACLTGSLTLIIALGRFCVLGCCGVAFMGYFYCWNSDIIGQLSGLEQRGEIHASGQLLLALAETRQQVVTAG